MTNDDRNKVRVRRDADARARLAAQHDPVIPPKEGTMPVANPKTPRGRKSATATPAAEAGTPETVEAPVDLTAALMAALTEKKVEGVERVDAKSGSYFRLMVGKTTVSYVNPSKKGLTLDLATPADKVPKGVETKPGPTASMPVKFKVVTAEDAKTAAALVALAVPAAAEAVTA